MASKSELEYSLSKEDLEKCLPFECPVYHYNQLKDFKNIDDLLKVNGCCILFIETMRKRKNFMGHWCCLCRSPSSNNPEETSIVFFDSYGSKVDQVKDYLSPEYLELSGQLEDVLNKLMAMSGDNLEYNEMKFQKTGKHNFEINTCGRYVVLKLLSKDLPLTYFQEFLKAKGTPADVKTIILTRGLLSGEDDPAEMMEKFNNYLIELNNY